MNKIEIGKIVNFHGLKGEAKIESWSDFDDVRYEKGNTVYLENDDTSVTVHVRSYRSHKGYALVAFEEFKDLTAIEPYKNFIVCIDEDDRHELEDGMFYVDDLIGLTVKDEEGNLIGEVIDVEETLGAQNNLRVRTESGKEVLIPNVPAFVLDIDLDSEEIKIRVVEGLL